MAVVLDEESLPISSLCRLASPLTILSHNHFFIQWILQLTIPWEQATSVTTLGESQLSVTAFIKKHNLFTLKPTSLY